MEFSGNNESPEKLLVERFRIMNGFHNGQRAIIEKLLQGKRVLAIQRTGWGKSLCYQMTSLYFAHLTIVFSPLKALMRDQYLRCKDIYHIPAAIVSSDFSDDENKITLLKAIDNHIKILFIAPERLSNLNWQEHVTHMRISMVVIDEAHCISTWGHDFRPDYRRIINLLELLPLKTPVLALTATANRYVEWDILQQMGDNTEVIRGTMQRPNLHLNVVPLNGDQEKLSYLATLLPQLAGTGIIYTATRNVAEMTAAFLQNQAINAEYYHAGRDDDERQRLEQGLLQNQYKVICSTNALGMGIDKPDLRFVIHYHFPASPIHYYQEIGRVGRDGQASYCILLYDKNDIIVQEIFAHNSKPESRYYTIVLSAIQQSSQRGLQRKELLLNTRVPSQNMLSTILADLQEQHFIEQSRGRYTSLPQLSQVDFSSYDGILRHKLNELQAMTHYATSNVCHMHYLASYLGDMPKIPCGICDYCTTTRFPLIVSAENTRLVAMRFLENFLPPIEKRGGPGTKHEKGWSLAYHGNSSIGRLVRYSKYENGGPFADELVYRAVQAIRQRYPLNSINAIVSVPPTKSGQLVEIFAKRVANMLSITYVLVLVKRRETREQKDFVNKAQKEQNVRDAFAISSPELVAGRTLLLIDDIYDSGYTLRAVTKILLQAGAVAVYPFTITRTLHSDDQ